MTSVVLICLEKRRLVFVLAMWLLRPGALHNLPHHYYAGFTHLWLLGLPYLPF